MYKFKLNFLKWWQTIKSFWAIYTTYRFNFIITVSGPALVFFFIKYNLWSSIYGGEGSEIIVQGYNFNQMIQYHVWTLVIALTGKGYMSMNISQDIRLGRISTYLVYPFNFWEFHTAGWIGHQILQLGIASLTILGIVCSGLISAPDFKDIAAGFFYCCVIGTFWYSLQYFIGLLGFWLEETWMIRVIMGIVTAFLSGAFVPLELYPSWLVEILNYTPFPYLTFYPVKVFMGILELQIKSLGIIVAWNCVLIVCNHLAWRRGVRLYTAAGM